MNNPKVSFLISVYSEKKEFGNAWFKDINSIKLIEKEEE